MKKNPSPAKANVTPTELLVRCQALLGQPVDSEQLMELVMQLLAQELIAAKLQGKAISDNLKLLSYLMRYAGLKLRAAAQRLRERKAETKSTTPPTRSQKSFPSATRTQIKAPPLITTPKPSLEDKAYMESLLEQYGYLPKERPHHPTNKFRINPQLLDLSFLDELSEMTKKAAA